MSTYLALSGASGQKHSTTPPPTPTLQPLRHHHSASPPTTPTVTTSTAPQPSHHTSSNRDRATPEASPTLHRDPHLAPVAVSFPKIQHQISKSNASRSCGDKHPAWRSNVSKTNSEPDKSNPKTTYQKTEPLSPSPETETAPTSTKTGPPEANRTTTIAGNGKQNHLRQTPKQNTHREQQNHLRRRQNTTTSAFQTPNLRLKTDTAAAVTPF
ncbi:hypothetical protein QL285_018729 [Trifolium repens]|nr:hypothetical protein QL285_018729 [Trifolium repens]